MSIKMPQHLQPSKPADIEYSLNLDPLKKKTKPSKKKEKSKKSKDKKKSKNIDADERDNVEARMSPLGEDFKKMEILTEALGGSADDTERTFLMDDSFSSDADSLKSTEKESKKEKKKKKSKSEGKSEEKKEKKKDRKGKSERNLGETKEKKKLKRSKSLVVAGDKKERKKERKIKSERDLGQKKRKEKKPKSEKKVGEKKEKKKLKRAKSEIIEVGVKKSKKKDKKAKSSRDLGELVSKSFKIGLPSIKEDDARGTARTERTLLLDDFSDHTDVSLVKTAKKVKLDKMSKAEKKVMKPKPGQKFVEFCKSGDDPTSGLELEVKGNFVFVKSVQHPAPSKNLHHKDRIIALNGKKIEDYKKDMTAITATLESGNPIRLVIDPTMLR